MIYWIFFILLSYLIGAFPTSYLAGKLLRGVDLREHGSGNLGATNVYRVLGLIPALMVLMLDVFKGFAPVFFLGGYFQSLTGVSASSMSIFNVVCGIFAISGHILSPFLGFKGGKGVATAAGVTLALSPLALGMSFMVWVLLFSIFRIVSVASLAAALFLPLFIYFSEGAAAGFSAIRAFGILIALVVLWTHRSNIGRLVQGKEKRLSRGENDS